MYRLWIVGLLFAVAGCSSAGKECAMSNDAALGSVRHVVFFKFKEGTSTQKIAEIEREFAALPGAIPQITGFEWGTNISPEGHDKGYTHCFLVTFADEAGRDAYLPHPAHKRFVDIALPHIEEVHVIDYIARR
jgi:hypothetical protein